MKTRMNITGRAIRKARYQRGWSQSQLAAKLQCQGVELDRGAISKIEPGIRRILDHELIAILHVLEMSLEELVPYRDIIAKARATTAQ